MRLVSVLMFVGHFLVFSKYIRPRRSSNPTSRSNKRFVRQSLTRTECAWVQRMDCSVSSLWKKVSSVFKRFVVRCSVQAHGGQTFGTVRVRCHRNCATNSRRNVRYQFPPKLTLPVLAETYAISSRRNVRCQFPPKLTLPVPAETYAASSRRNLRCQFPPKLTLPVPAETHATSSRRNVRYQFPPKRTLPVPAETYATSSRRNVRCVFVSNLEIHWKFKLCMPNIHRTSNSYKIQGNEIWKAFDCFVVFMWHVIKFWHVWHNIFSSLYWFTAV